MGGEQATDLVQIYDPEVDSWSYGARMPTARIGLAMAVVDDRLYAIGGATGYALPPDWNAIAENAMYTPAAYPGSIDGTKPVITVFSPENRTYNSSSVSLVFAVNEQTSWMGYSIDGEEKRTVTGNTTISGLPNGLHNVKVYANDTAGNAGVSGTIDFTIAEPFSIVPVAAAVVIVVAVAAGLLVYFKKRKR